MLSSSEVFSSRLYFLQINEQIKFQSICQGSQNAPLMVFKGNMKKISQNYPVKSSQKLIFKKLRSIATSKSNQKNSKSPSVIAQTLKQSIIRPHSKCFVNYKQSQGRDIGVFRSLHLKPRNFRIIEKYLEKNNKKPQLFQINPNAYETYRKMIYSPLQHLSLIHISEPTRPLYISYAVFCLKKKKKNITPLNETITHRLQNTQKNIK
eukprot:TRINITY_DN35924_c0_g1_i1.p1 TRINITY_DN35924_c0_g1~~TRINITY_DN35924_c0_g1_i1.p1  ORF type:complete len:207 (-),score=20.29 TRINITY_DN35924_c0_g1_i1:20-640(-)